MFERSALEDWLRDYYFDASADISSSGVEPYTFAELRSTLDSDLDGLGALSFRDSRTAGATHLRSLIAHRWGDGNSSRVVATNGSTEAQLLVLLALLRKDDEVVVVEPAYHTLLSIATAIGCHVLRWHLRPEQGFAANVDDLRRLVSSKTRMIIVNFPHNPTGVTVTPTQQLEIVQIASKYGSYLFWDGAFEDLTFEAAPLAAVANLYDRGISFGSLSKAFGLPGLRIGWSIGPEAVVDRVVSIRDYTSLALSPMAEFVGEKVLEHADRALASRLQLARMNRGLVKQWLDGHGAHLIRAQLSAGVLTFAFLPTVHDTVQFCRKLMDERGVLLVPGECFGHPGFVRLGFGASTDSLRRGLDGLSEQLHATLSAHD